MEKRGPDALRPEAREVYEDGVQTRACSQRRAEREAWRLMGDEMEAFIDAWVDRHGVDLNELLRALWELEDWFRKEDERIEGDCEAGRTSRGAAVDRYERLCRRYRTKLRQVRMVANGIDPGDIGRLAEEYDHLIDRAWKASHGVDDEASETVDDDTDEDASTLR